MERYKIFPTRINFKIGKKNYLQIGPSNWNSTSLLLSKYFQLFAPCFWDLLANDSLQSIMAFKRISYFNIT